MPAKGYKKSEGGFAKPTRAKTSRTQDRWHTRSGPSALTTKRWACRLEQEGLRVGVLGCGFQTNSYIELEGHDCGDGGRQR